MWFFFFWSFDSSLGFSRGVEPSAVAFVKLKVFLPRASLDIEASEVCRDLPESAKFRPRVEAVMVLELDAELGVEGDDRRRRFWGNDEVDEAELGCRCILGGESDDGYGAECIARN